MTIIDAAKAGGRWTAKGATGHFVEFGEWLLLNGVNISKEAFSCDDWEPVPEEPPQWCNDAAKDVAELCICAYHKENLDERCARMIAKHWRKAGKP